MTNEQLKEMSIRQAAGMRAMSTKEIERMQKNNVYLAYQQGPLSNGEYAQMLNSCIYAHNITAFPRETPPPTWWERVKRWLLN